MKISLLGVVSIAYSLFLILKKRDFASFYCEFLALTLIVTTNIHMGYFLKMGELVFTYDSFFIYSLMLLSIIFLGGKLYRKDFIFLSIFFSVLILNYCSFLFFPYREKVIVGDWEGYLLGNNVYSFLGKDSIAVGYYFVLISIAIIVITVYRNLDISQLKLVLAKVVDISKCSIVLGYIEFVTKNILHTTIVTDMCIALFGVEGMQQNRLTNRNGLITLQGATKEASMFTTVIFYIVILMAVQGAICKDKYKKNKKWIFASVVLLLINPAMSAYVYVLIIFLILITSGLIDVSESSKKLMNRNSILIVCITIIGVILGAILFNNLNRLIDSSNYLLHRIGLAIQQFKIIVSGTGKLVNSSEAQRLSGIVYDFKMWLKKPFLGYGAGTIYCVSGFISFLTDFGLITVLAYVYIICHYGKSEIANKSIVLLFFCEIWILPNLFLNDLKTIMLLIIPFTVMLYAAAFESPRLPSIKK